MKTIAVYAGTFDPITFGHMDIIERAAALFDEVIVAVAANPGKNPLLTLAERVSLSELALAELSNVFVEGFSTLTLAFAKQKGAKVLIRGLRAVADFDYEFQLANMNRTLDPSIETLFLMPAEKHMFISSSLIREIALHHGEINAFVPPMVAKAILSKITK